MRNPLFIMMTDDHLSDSSFDLCIDIHRQVRSKAKQLGLKCVYHTGDIIDSRKAQTWTVLKSLIQIFQEYEKDDLELRIIPGNHSKPDYESEESFLDVFQRYPAFKLIRDCGTYIEGNVAIHMIPFFDENIVYPHYLKRAVEQSKAHSHLDANILLTHVGVDGVRRNDGTNVDNDLRQGAFNQFDLVFIGHYHDYQEVGDNIVYYGSTHQHNFGEDENKGMTVVYDDLTFEQIKLNVPTYNTTIIDLNKIAVDEVKVQLQQIHDSGNFEKVKFTGTREKLSSLEKAIKSTQLVGIKVEKIIDDPIVDISYEDLLQFKGFDNSSILEEWKNFTSNKKLSKTQISRGQQRLKLQLQ